MRCTTTIVLVIECGALFSLKISVSVWPWPSPQITFKVKYSVEKGRVFFGVSKNTVCTCSVKSLAKRISDHASIWIGYSSPRVSWESLKPGPKQWFFTEPCGNFREDSKHFPSLCLEIPHIVPSLSRETCRCVCRHMNICKNSECAVCKYFKLLC